jgi:hypothetical protein
MNTDYSFPEHPQIDPPAEPEPVECLACCGQRVRLMPMETWPGGGLPSKKSCVLVECPHCQGQGVVEPETAEVMREIRAQEKLARRMGK